jgi:hypothetical protein
LLPSGPGEVHGLHAARGADPLYPVPASGRRGAGGGAGGGRGSVSLPAEDSPRGLGRTLGKRVGLTPSRVRISYPPPPPSRADAAGPGRWSGPWRTGRHLRRDQAVGRRRLDHHQVERPCCVPHAVPDRAPANRGLQGSPPRYGAPCGRRGTPRTLSRNGSGSGCRPAFDRLAEPPSSVQLTYLYGWRNSRSPPIPAIVEWVVRGPVGGHRCWWGTGSIASSRILSGRNGNGKSPRRIRGASALPRIFTFFVPCYSVAR